MGKEKKKDKKHKDRYRSFGKALNADIAIVQAALAVDDLAMKAKRTKDTDLMLACVNGWVAIAVALHTMENPQGEPEDDDVVYTTSVMGFASKESREEAENAYKDKSRGRDDSQSGRFRVHPV